jgi:molybdopterin-guanine dinucleotide biosynthesis protein A
LSRAGSQGVTGFVLAGGESRRMGRDKALVNFAGQPLVARALGILRGAGLVTKIAGSRTGLEQFAAVVADTEPGRGPLAGICAALAECKTQTAVFLPVDLPLLPSSLVTFMVHRTIVTKLPVTTVSAGGIAQTFPVVLDRSMLPGLEAELKGGQGGCFAAFETAAARLGERSCVVPVEYLAQAGQVIHPGGLPAAFWFLNANCMADLKRAEAICGCEVA